MNRAYSRFSKKQVRNGRVGFDRTGRHLGIVPVPEPTTNVAFGDADARTLCITASKSVYRIRLENRGWDVD